MPTPTHTGTVTPPSTPNLNNTPGGTGEGIAVIAILAVIVLAILLTAHGRHRK